VLKQRPFYGFDITDEEVGPGEYHALAIKVKHIFEGIASDADEKNEEIFLDPKLEHTLRRFLVDPSQASRTHLVEVSPVLAPELNQLVELTRMATGPPHTDRPTEHDSELTAKGWRPSRPCGLPEEYLSLNPEHQRAARKRAMAAYEAAAPESRKQAGRKALIEAALDQEN
jgi:hypothetical protein